MPALVLIAILGAMLPGGCSNTTPSGSEYYLRTNQQWIEGLISEDIDTQDIYEVFWAVFSRLPDQVTVYPSENYYYFALYVNGREFWGNIRLPAGRRENGILSFAYFEFDEFPTTGDEDGATYSNLFDVTDGLTIEEVDPFKWIVRYKGKAVTFNLNQTGQGPPTLFTPGENEIVVERTFDESGYQFFLMFHEDDLVPENNYFFWVLNEEDGAPDVFDNVTSDTYTETDIIVGRRSGFAFWVDAEHDNRKVLASIRQLSVMRNDYYDGPFDQLADNYVYTGEINILSYFIKALPGLEGRIDKYGYYTDTTKPLRVALSSYGTYYTNSQLITFVASAKASSDVYHYFSSRGAFKSQ